MDYLEQLVREFKQHGYKMTPQRRAIIEILARHASQHPTAEQIHEHVLGRMPDISLATVYNTLRELVAIEQAQELNLGHCVRRYELTVEDHAHRVCLRCGAITDVPADLSCVEALLHHDNGFRPTRYDVTVWGTCGDCAGAVQED